MFKKITVGVHLFVGSKIPTQCNSTTIQISGNKGYKADLIT